MQKISTRKIKNLYKRKGNDDTLKVLHVVAECAPYSKVGGLSQVVESLSREFGENGHDVKIFMPKFATIDEEKNDLVTIYENLKVPTGHDSNEEYNYVQELTCNVKSTQMSENVEVLFLENMEYYEKRSKVYEYSDDYIRWSLLSKGALEYLFQTNEQWLPDVIHVHDWHTSLIPNMIKDTPRYSLMFEDVVTVLTIHNIVFQGQRVSYDSDLHYDDGHSKLPGFFSERFESFNFLKRGVLYADVISTVSNGYLQEILTEDGGYGMHTLLLELRSKIFGITNGLNFKVFNPETDHLIHTNYNYSTLEKRVDNKINLQKEFGLKTGSERFTLGFVGRMTNQKGVDLIIDVLKRFFRDFDAQFFIVGGGEKEYIDMIQSLKNKHPEKVGAHLYPNFSLPKLIFSGVDALIVPSRWEPCGIIQLEAMRYGAVPIVRAVGGLDDTVDDFNPETKEGTGFKFKEFDGWSLYGQLVRAKETFRNKSLWRDLQINCMTTDNSWGKVAKDYEWLYEVGKNFKLGEYTEKNRYDEL